MYSLYWNNLWDGRHEVLGSFEDALDAEKSRKQGMGIPPTCTWPDALRYREIIRYAEQLERYFEAFDSSQVQVVVYDRFKTDVSRTYRQVLDFLELDEPLHPPDFEVINQSRTWRSRFIRDITAGRRLGYVRNLAGKLLSNQTKYAVSRHVRKINTKVQPRPQIRPELRRSLTEECADGVRDLENLIGQDLRAWLPTDIDAN